MYIYQIAITGKKSIIGKSFTDYNLAISNCEQLTSLAIGNNFPITYYVQPVWVE